MDEKIEQELVKKYKNANSIVLYGSCLYKDNPNDIDVLIIDENYNYEQTQEGKFDIIFTSKDNFKKNILQNNPLFQSILFNFKIIKDNNNIFKSNMRRYYYYLKNNQKNIYNIKIKNQKWKIKQNLNRLQLCF